MPEEKLLVRHHCVNERRIKTLEDTSHKTLDLVSEIRHALLPTDLNPETGIIKQVSTLMKDVQDIKKDNFKLKVQLSTIISIGALALIVIELYFKIQAAR